MNLYLPIDLLIYIEGIRLFEIIRKFIIKLEPSDNFESRGMEKMAFTDSAEERKDLKEMQDVLRKTIK